MALRFRRRAQLTEVLLRVSAVFASVMNPCSSVAYSDIRPFGLVVRLPSLPLLSETARFLPTMASADF